MSSKVPVIFLLTLVLVLPLFTGCQGQKREERKIEKEIRRDEKGQGFKKSSKKEIKKIERSGKKELRKLKVLGRQGSSN